MIYKIILNVSGENFNSRELINKLDTNILIASINHSEEVKFNNSDAIMEYGNVSFWHPKKFCVDEHIELYERWFVEFLDKHNELFLQYGGDQIEIYFELYYQDEQCNFEIFNKILLHQIMKFQPAIPVSIYKLKEEEYNNWSQEIRNGWQ